MPLKIKFFFFEFKPFGKFVDCGIRLLKCYKEKFCGVCLATQKESLLRATHLAEEIAAARLKKIPKTLFSNK